MKLREDSRKCKEKEMDSNYIVELLVEQGGTNNNLVLVLVTKRYYEA